MHANVENPRFKAQNVVKTNSTDYRSAVPARHLRAAPTEAIFLHFSDTPLSCTTLCSPAPFSVHLTFSTLTFITFFSLSNLCLHHHQNHYPLSHFSLFHSNLSTFHTKFTHSLNPSSFSLKPINFWCLHTHGQSLFQHLHFCVCYSFNLLQVGLHHSLHFHSNLCFAFSLKTPSSVKSFCIFNIIPSASLVTIL